jgi:MFS family permease
MPSILKNRDFMRLWFGNTVAYVGLRGASFAYPILALVMTGSPISVSWVSFALLLPSMIFEVPSGIVADQWDQRRTLVRCQCMGLAATLLAAIVTVAHPFGLTLLLCIASFIEGTAYVFFSTSELVVVRDIVTESERPEAFSFLEAEQPFANMVGRMLGSATFGIARSLPFLANAAAYLYCLWTLAKLRTRIPAKSEPNGRKLVQIWSWGETTAGIRELWGDPFVRGATVVLAVTNAIFQVVVLILTLKVKDGGHSVWTIGVVLGSTGLGGMLGAAVAPRIADRHSPRMVLICVGWAWVACGVAVAASSNVVVLWFGFAGVGYAAAILGVSLTLHRMRAFHEDHVGRIWGATKFIAHGCSAIGALVAGTLVEWLGIRATGWVLVVGLVLVVRYARGLPEPWRPEPAPAPVLSEGATNWIAQLSRKGPVDPDGR